MRARRSDLLVLRVVGEEAIEFKTVKEIYDRRKLGTKTEKDYQFKVDTSHNTWWWNTNAHNIGFGYSSPEQSGGIIGVYDRRDNNHLARMIAEAAQVVCKAKLAVKR
jgi:hypothetical protein